MYISTVQSKLCLISTVQWRKAGKNNINFVSGINFIFICIMEIDKLLVLGVICRVTGPVNVMVILRLHYVPGGHGGHVSDNREQNGITVWQHRGTG